MEQGDGRESRGGVEEKDRMGRVTEHTVRSRQCMSELGGEWRGEVMEEVSG